MKFLLFILIIFIVLILIILGTILFLYFKAKKFTQNMGYNNIESLVNMIKNGEKTAKFRHKSISGMTKVLLPKIIADFPNFNESELYNKVEVSLLAIFSSLSKKEICDKGELAAIRYNLDEQIKDMTAIKKDMQISDVIFHKHAIKSYQKKSNVLEIEVNSSLEYFLQIKKNGQTIDDKDYKRQTTYTTKFIYIYNEDEFETSKNNFSLHCPNCGAPLKNIKDHFCPYCNSGVENINMRNWYIIDYKENY